MTAFEALRAARSAGVEVALDGDDLVLKAASPPPASVLDALSCNKAGIVALLRSGDDGWSAEDWQLLFDERAGIAEFDGGLSRVEAEAQAFACCITEWMNRQQEDILARPLPRLSNRRQRQRSPVAQAGGPPNREVGCPCAESIASQARPKLSTPARRT